MRWLAFVVVLGLCLSASSVSAEPALAEFEQHLRAGVAAQDAGNHKEALYEFERAREFHDAPLLRYHIATTLAELGECQAAEVQFRLVAEADESDADLRRAAREGLQKVPGSCGQPPQHSIVIEEVGEGAREEESARQMAETPKRRAWTIAGWSMLGTGAVLGAAIWLKWSVERSQVEDGYNVIGVDYGCTYDRGTNAFSGVACDESAMRADSRYADFEEALGSVSRLNTTLGITAAVLAAGGATSLIVRAFSRDDTTVVVSPVGPSVGLSIAW